MTKTLQRRQVTWMMAVLLVGSFITTLAETLMNNGLPMIMKETGASQMDAQWLNTGYMLASGMVMPLADFVMHRFSLRQLFAATMSIFLLGSTVAALALGFNTLLAGRLIQALAVGINMPLITNVLTVIIPPRHRGMALGIAGVIINLGPAIGPTLSGVILEFFSWRMLFIILIPITALTIAATPFCVKNVIQPRAIQIDFPSAILAVDGLGALLYSLGRCGVVGQDTRLTVTVAVGGAVMLAWFIHRQLVINHPLLDLWVFQFGQYRLGTAITLLTSAAIMAPELTLPLFNQNILHVTPIVSGEVMIPSALSMALLSPLAGRLYDEFGARRLSIAGALVGLLAALPMFFYDSATSIILITVFYAFRCAGLTLSYTPANVYALNALPQRSVTSGNTIIVTLVQVANSFGTALAVTAQSLVQRWNISQGVVPRLAAVHGYQWSFGSMIVVTLFAVLLSGKIKERHKN